VRCRDNSLYTGIATDVQRRLQEHGGTSRGARYLRGKGPLELMFHAEAGSRSRASQLEARIKRLPRPQKLRLISGELAIHTLLHDAPESSVPVMDKACG